MDCNSVRQSLSEGDRRMLRGRKIRAHLASCRGCSTFADALRARPAQLAALAPPLAPAASAGLLKGLLGGSTKGGGEGGAAAVVASGGGKLVAGSMTIKAVAVATVAVTAGAVGAGASGHLPGPLADVVGGRSQEEKPAAERTHAGPVGGANGPDAERDERSRAERRQKRAAARADRKKSAGEANASDGSHARRESGAPGTNLKFRVPAASGGRRAGHGQLPDAVREQLQQVPLPQVTRPSLPDRPTLPQPPSVELPRTPDVPVRAPSLP